MGNYLTERRERTVEFEDVVSTGETDLAVWCIIDGEKYNIPKSQIHDDSEVWKKDQHGTLIITRWIAEQKGLV